jgi:hypothetical protein
VFGDLRDQSVATDEKLRRQLSTGFIRVLPTKLPNGSAILYLELRRHNALEYSAQDTLKAWHYVIMSTLKSDPDVAVNGFTVIGLMSDVGYSNLDIHIPEGIIGAVSNCMPVRLRNMFICHPPLVARVLIPIVKMLLSSKLGHRLYVVTDDTNISTNHEIPVSLLPHTLGGQIGIDDLEGITPALLQQNFVV